MTEPYKPILRPDQLVSPRISTRDRIILGKRGVCFNGLAWHERFLRMLSEKNCFWGRCPGCNPPSVLSSICLIGEPAPPAERSPGEGMSSSSWTGQGLVSAPPHRLSPGTSYDHNGLRHVGGVSSRPPSMAL